MNGKRIAAIVLIVIGAASYGLLSPFIKFAYDDGYTEGAVSAAQMTGGTALLWLMLACTPGAWQNPWHGPWVRLALVGICGLASTTVLYNHALAAMDASVAIVFLFQFTWITVAMQAIATRTWPTRYQLLGVAVVMAGTLCAVDVFAADLARISWRGAVFGLLSAVTYSFFIFMTGRIRTEMHSLLRSIIMLTAALPFIYILYPPAAFVQPGGGTLLLWGLLLGLLGQSLPTVTFNIGVPRVGSSLAALLGSMELPVAVTAAYLILGEQVQAIQWAGMALILVGIFISERAGDGSKRKAAG